MEKAFAREELMKAVPHNCMRCKEAARATCTGNCNMCIEEFDKHDGCNKWGAIKHAEEEAKKVVPDGCAKCEDDARAHCSAIMGGAITPSFVQVWQKAQTKHYDNKCDKCIAVFTAKRGCALWSNMEKAQGMAK